MARKKKNNGLGDVVATVTQFVGIQPCEACKERQAKWNALYPMNLQSREVTDDEWIEWNTLDAINKTIINSLQVDYICNFYASVFQVPVFKPSCLNCSAKPILKMITKLNELYNTK